MQRLDRLSSHLLGKPVTGALSNTSGRSSCYALESRIASAEQAEPALYAGFLGFSPKFVFGVATAAYQIEGAVSEGGRKPSIWDEFSHTPGRTFDGATGDIACDHYHCCREDVALLAKLGVRAYRFSISWSRILPDGDGVVNEDGVRFYSDLIAALIEHKIDPWVTLYHWDLPLALEKRFGGWLGPKESIVSAFSLYARTCFNCFGDRVKNWVTLNEPFCISVLGYGIGMHAPGRSSSPETEPYLVAHNLLLAHAAAVNIYREEFSERQNGLIGIALNAEWCQPSNPDSEHDVEVARHHMDFSLGWFADPLFFGEYPASMRSACGDRLPTFTSEESTLLKGSVDFFGLNCYSARSIAARERNIAPREAHGNVSKASQPRLRGYLADLAKGSKIMQDENWERTDMDWPIVPWGLRELLLDIQKRYNPRYGIVVTENGCAQEPTHLKLLDDVPHALKPQASSLHEDVAGETGRDVVLNDPERIRYIRAHLAGVHAARAYGADVRGYFLWSFLDNFEWSHGYAKRFGLVRVDYRTQKRTIKESGYFYADIIKNSGLQSPEKSEQFGGIPY